MPLSAKATVAWGSHPAQGGILLILAKRPRNFRPGLISQCEFACQTRLSGTGSFPAVELYARSGLCDKRNLIAFYRYAIASILDVVIHSFFQFGKNFHALRVGSHYAFIFHVQVVSVHALEIRLYGRIGRQGYVAKHRTAAAS